MENEEKGAKKMFLNKLKKFGEKLFDKNKLGDESGAALAIAIIILVILAVVAMTALAFSSTEARIAGSDLQRTQTFYATVTAMEKMTNDFSNLFRKKMQPTLKDLDDIEDAPPNALEKEGFKFEQTLEEDAERLTQLRAMQSLPNNVYPRVNIDEGPFAGLYASVIPYKISSMATMQNTGTQVKLEREFNNYLVPLFQFGIYSNEDLEFAPGPLMTFNGRTHTNGNIYALRNIKFLNRLSMSGEFIRNASSGGEPNTASGSGNVWVEVNNINVTSTFGSMQAGGGTVGGPNITGSKAGERGYFPGSPNGVPNPNWESESVKPAAWGKPNRFGGQVLTNTTGASELKTPLELSGNSPAEIIKRSLPSDSEILSISRYHTKSQIRILIDEEAAGSGKDNAAGIPAGKGVLLSTFIPTALNGGNALRQISDTGTISGSLIKQINPDKSVTSKATTVRAITKDITALKNAPVYSPPGSGILGKILIEVVKPDGTTIDVTQTILSMGATVGEPNGIVYLQRPLWAAAVQGSRDRSGGGFDLVNLTNNSQIIADGELDTAKIPSFFNTNRGYISGAQSAIDDDGGNYAREAVPTSYNVIVPINVYNVREGWVRSTMSEQTIYYERGITSVVELNMHNLARWFDGVYDANLLSGTNAVSANIKSDEGYVVYVSDRRGDNVKNEYLSDGTVYKSTNGNVDNEDIYGPNGKLDNGEDVIDFGWDASKGGASKKGSLQKDITELPDEGGKWDLFGLNPAQRLTYVMTVMSYETTFFRRSVRLFDGEKLSVSGLPGKLSPTKGITVASENMAYIWGNYNTNGITGIPSGGSTTNNGGYTGAQIPSSIVCDAFFPLSKTWFDSLSAMYPEGSANPKNMTGDSYRMADENLPSTSRGTSVRAGIIAGTTLSALNGTPGRNADGLRRSGGIINYPRFLEIWNDGTTTNSWNYTGSFIPLFHSTQALSQWENDTSVIYLPPRRNWSFDETFLTPNKLPPGTPFFQYIQATGFRQSLK